MDEPDRTFDSEELSEYDGTGGGPPYVAFRGKVYDLTGSPLWEGGDHQGLHSAGRDVSEEIADAPHGEEMLEGFPVVGEFEG